MNQFPYWHEEEPDAERPSRIHKVAPYMAATAMLLWGGAIGANELKPAHKGPNSSSEPTPADCFAEGQWRQVPSQLDFKFLATLMGVSEGRAENSVIAMADCPQGIAAGDVLTQTIRVQDKEGPCMAADVLGAQKPANPMTKFHKILAICAGQNDRVI